MRPLPTRGSVAVLSAMIVAGALAPTAPAGTPANELLSDRAENEAYLAARPGQAYALYFTDGGSPNRADRQAVSSLTDGPARHPYLSACVWRAGIPIAPHNVPAGSRGPPQA